jgi:hypothetical protein
MEENTKKKWREQGRSGDGQGKSGVSSEVEEVDGEEVEVSRSSGGGQGSSGCEWGCRGCGRQIFEARREVVEADGEMRGGNLGRSRGARGNGGCEQARNGGCARKEWWVGKKWRLGGKQWS